MKVNRVNMRDYFVLPHPQLKNYFRRQREGNQDIYETPLWKGRDIRDVLDEWEGILDRVCANYPTLLEFEHDLGKKAGPMSIQKPLVERLPDIEAYYTGVTLSSSSFDPVYIDYTHKHRWKGIHNLKMISESEVLQTMKKSTNSGVPYFTRRGVVIMLGKLGYAEFVNGEWIIVCPDGRFKVAAILGWRGQEGGPLPEDVKQRVLWMFAMLLNILEARVYNPLIKGFQRNGLMPTWQQQAVVDATMTRLFDTKDPSDYIVGTDFSKFDQHMNADMQQCGKECIQRIFNDPHLSEWLETVYPEKYQIPLIIDWGKATFGNHGMASGSGGTNADETLAHSVLQSEAAVTAGVDLNVNSMCLGDDGVLSYKGIDVDHVLDVYTSHGQEMNPSKQSVSRDSTVFLRRLYAEELRTRSGLQGVYSTERAISRCKMLERYVNPEDYGPEYIIVHSMSILENLASHPAREQCADFVREGDAFGLGTKIPGFFDGRNFAEAVERVAAAGGLGWQYINEFSTRPATSWWIYQYMKSKV